MYIFDTDHLSLADRDSDPSLHRLRARLDKLRPGEGVTIVVTIEEQMRGWMALMAGSRLPRHQIRAYRNLREFVESVSRMTILDFDEAAANQFAALRKLRLRVGTMDLRIAAIALARDATVLTRNLRDFTKVPGLRAEDWTR